MLQYATTLHYNTHYLVQGSTVLGVATVLVVKTGYTVVWYIALWWGATLVLNTRLTPHHNAMILSKRSASHSVEPGGMQQGRIQINGNNEGQVCK